MDDLIAFVTARLDEDEQWAKDLIAYGPGDISWAPPEGASDGT